VTRISREAMPTSGRRFENSLTTSSSRSANTPLEGWPASDSEALRRADARFGAGNRVPVLSEQASYPTVRGRRRGIGAPGGDCSRHPQSAEGLQPCLAPTATAI